MSRETNRSRKYLRFLDLNGDGHLSKEEILQTFRGFRKFV
ncbi:MAG: hypothetical protein GDA56_15610 [Hormoscilla sp. GM7CHS1pb]|nr:hypothetical protein [Hormoscilla sp. GM7CHS1pb]